MNFREVKYLAAGIVVVSLVTTIFIIPAVLTDLPAERITAISKPTPIEPLSIPEPVRVLSPAEASARAAAIQAHANRILAENGELPEASAPSQSKPDADSKMKCVAGCD